MLGTVARKLRFFGFDTLYIVNSTDDEIIRKGINQDRFILTCDKDMYRRIVKAGAKGILLKGLDDVEDISQTFLSYGISLGPYIDVNSRCSMCNGLLVVRSRAEIIGRMNPNVINWQKRFFECKRCSKLYWEGGHYIRLMDLSKRIDSRIKEQLEEDNSQ
jgi:uncharacterized protein with PIN domain